MYEPPKCRKCGKVIAFLPMRSGKQMPVDGFSIWIQPWTRGSVFYTEKGEAIRGTKCEKGDKNAVKAYQSHFATCSAADEIRRTKTKSARHESVRRIVEREKAEAAARELRREEKAKVAESIAEAQAAQCSLFPDPSWR